MAVIDKAREIHAPIASVFAIVEDPNRIAEFTPGVTRVEDVHRTDQRIGDSFRIVYSVLGISMPMRFVATDWVRDQKITTRMEGSMPGTFAWTFEPHGDATRVAIHVDYQVKGGPVGKAVDALLIERMNDKNIERVLENLSLICESAPGGTASGTAS